MLQQLQQKHPEWTQPELAKWIGRSLGWVKKWVKRLREAPPNDTSVLFGKPFGRKIPYPQTDPAVEARILAIRDAPPENLKRTPGPRAILYYLPRDPSLQQRTEVLPLPHAPFGKSSSEMTVSLKRSAANANLPSGRGQKTCVWNSPARSLGTFKSSMGPLVVARLRV